MSFVEQVSDDVVAKEVLQFMVYRSSMFGIANLVFGIGVVIIYQSYPLTLQNRSLPYGLYLMSIDYRASPIYEISYFLEFAITIANSMWYIAFINLYVTFLLFGFALLRILKYKFGTIAGPFREMAGPDNDLIARQFGQYIETHNKIIEYVYDMNEIYSDVYFIEMLLYGFLLSALLFLMAIVEKTSQVLLIVVYIAIVISQLFIIYYISNEMIEEVSYSKLCDP